MRKNTETTDLHSQNSLLNVDKNDIYGHKHFCHFDSFEILRKFPLDYFVDFTETFFQNVDLRKHLTKAERDIERLIPDSIFSGPAVIDWYARKLFN
jgi:hypothetical protein